MKLNDLIEQIKRKDCKWCDYEGLDLEDPQMYVHPGGYPIEGEEWPQWVYIECPNCGYAHSLWKLGVPHPSSFDDNVKEVRLDLAQQHINKLFGVDK